MILVLSLLIFNFTPGFLELPQTLPAKGVVLDAPMRFHSGDNPQWASPQFQDGDWEVVSPLLRPGESPAWSGVAWFRLRLKTPPDFSQQQLALFCHQAGNLDVYLDGTFLGEMSRDHSWLSLSLSPGEHLLAFRYSISTLEKFHDADYFAGFYLRLSNLEQGVNDRAALLEDASSTQGLFTAIALALAVLQLILYLYAPRSRGNLYFTLYLLAWAAAFWMDYQNQFFSQDQGEQLFNLRVHRFAGVLSGIFFLRFVYSICYHKAPRQFPFFVVGYLFFGWLTYLKPSTYYSYAVIFNIGIVSVEIVRVLTIAIRKKEPGLRLFGLGLFSLYFFGFYDTLLDLNLIDPIGGVQNTYFFGVLGLFLSTSIYLARDMARNQDIIISQERDAGRLELERKLLEADNARKTKELEDARNLQLSMLPKSLPHGPNYRMKAYMATATEVGGDYYDFQSSDGVLTLAVGDATGHGARAGAMVGAVKSLFLSSDGAGSISDFFNNCTGVIKKMGMANMYMALLIMRLEGNRMVLSGAGMPPALIYGKQGGVREIKTSGPPLGAVKGIAYKEYELELLPGDRILLYSDGLPELFNQDDVMLGYPRVKELLQENGGQDSAGIIKSLIQAGDNWRGQRELDDDMTLVVLEYGAL